MGVQLKDKMQLLVTSHRDQLWLEAGGTFPAIPSEGVRSSPGSFAAKERNHNEPCISGALSSAPYVTVPCFQPLNPCHSTLIKAIKRVNGMLGKSYGLYSPFCTRCSTAPRPLLTAVSWGSLEQWFSTLGSQPLWQLHIRYLYYDS